MPHNLKNVEKITLLLKFIYKFPTKMKKKQKQDEKLIQQISLVNKAESIDRDIDKSLPPLQFLSPGHHGVKNGMPYLKPNLFSYDLESMEMAKNQI